MHPRHSWTALTSHCNDLYLVVVAAIDFTLTTLQRRSCGVEWCQRTAPESLPIVRSEHEQPAQSRQEPALLCEGLRLDRPQPKFG